MPNTVFNVQGLKFIRARKTILDIDSLSIDQGRFVNIIGTNGAGKTTLLKLLCALIKPTIGNIEFDDQPIFALSPWKRTNIRKLIGYIPQAAEYNTHLPFTVKEVAAMGRASVTPLLKQLNKDDYNIVDQWLERLDLTRLKDQTFRSLSGGERQKVLIARAMVQNPKVLMLDEPTSNLDFHWKKKITQLVRTLQQQMNLTVIMVSHDISSITLDDSRTILLDNGKIIEDAPSRQLLTSETIERVYHCRIKILNSGSQEHIVNCEITGS